MTSIAATLGIGSGIDTQALVEQLTAAVRDPKEAALKKREETNAAQISTLGQASSAIDSFADALSSLISGGTLFTQPNVSDTSLMTAVALPGTRFQDFSAQMQVDQLAQTQTIVSAPLTDSAAAVGQGDLTLTTSKGSFVVTIDSTNDSLAGLADAINSKNAGVTASILTESGNARLVIKSNATGAAEAFTLSVPAGTASGLERFAYGAGVTGGMTLAQTAQDAIVHLDGVEVKRASNTITDLLPGMQIDLKKAAPGTNISIGLTRPTESIKQAVNDFVSAYNELHKVLADATAPATAGAGTGGVLRGDLGIAEMQRQLSRLTTTVINSSGGPSTLAEIGVKTNRDGTLSVDTTQLDAILESDPQGVEALFNPTQYSSDPLVTVWNQMGKAKPGTYTLTNLVPANGSTGATGEINGVSGISSGTRLVATASSGAVGLVVEVLGPVSSATVTVDSGLGGALQAIRDALRAKSGPLETSQERLEQQAETIADDREEMERRVQVYHDQLVNSFSAMDRRVSAFKATQSYLDQQIKIWTANND